MTSPIQKPGSSAGCFLLLGSTGIRPSGQLSPLTGDQSRRGVEGVDHRSNTQGVGAHSAVPQQQLGADEDGADAE